MALYGLRSNQTIIVPDQINIFLSIIQSKTTDRVRLKNIEAEVISIQHKLNVIRYHAGLIQTLSEKDYGEFQYRQGESNKLSYADYQDRCVFTMSNKPEYELFLTFFIETLAANSFSLFDICAHLLTDIFDLPLPRSTRSGSGTINISYKQVLQENKLKIDFPVLHNFLCRYRATSRGGNTHPNQVSWINPLEDIRHQITHKPINDIIGWIGNAGVYSTEENSKFFLHANFFNTQPNGEELKSFAEQCFDGIEEFVDELFQKLIAEINQHGSIPI